MLIMKIKIVMNFTNLYELTTVLKITSITIQSTVFVHHILCKYILDKFKEIKNWLYDYTSNAVMIPAALIVEFYKRSRVLQKLWKFTWKWNSSCI